MKIPENKKKGYYYDGKRWVRTERISFLGRIYVNPETLETRAGGPPRVLNPRHDRRSINDVYDPDRDER